MTIPALGKDQYLYVATYIDTVVGTYAEIVLATDVNVNREKSEIDVTNRESARAGYTSVIQGLKSLSVEYTMHLPALGETASAGDAIVLDAWENDTVISMKVTNGDGGDGFTTFCTVGGGSEAQPVNGAVTRTVKLTSVGAPVTI